MIRRTTLLKLSFAAALALVALTSTSSAAADPNGNWKVAFTTPNGQEIELLLTLKADGDKLTGKVTRNDRSTDITDGTFKNDEVSFNVVRERDGQKFTSKYQGKVEADSIKGKIEVEFGGDSLSFDWGATREK